MGSPPHVRGKAISKSHLPTSCGITPACAGKSFLLCGGDTWFRDHPRMCGEKYAGYFVGKAGEGSPPHVRGKGFSGFPALLLDGITPACAGKSCFWLLPGPLDRDHPRMCGEKRADARARARVIGSPPRMRGKVVVLDLHQLCGGITPAYAGKSWPWQRAAWRTRDHPRVCGEKQNQAISIREEAGSPPRMRGKVSRALKG